MSQIGELVLNSIVYPFSNVQGVCVCVNTCMHARERERERLQESKCDLAQLGLRVYSNVCRLTCMCMLGL